MTGEFNIAGIYIHPLMVAAIAAFLLARGLELGLQRTGFYRHVWHRGLFDVGLTVTLWAAIASLITTGGFSGLFPS